VDEVCAPQELRPHADTAARVLGGKDPAAFRSIKELLREPVAEEMLRREQASIQEFVEIWYSESTWQKLRDIRIHG
jgi:hypothetical protein